MANEVTLNATLNIRKLDADGVTELVKRSYQGSFRDDMAGARGPSPGVVTALDRAGGGTQVSFAQLTRPAWCWFEHLGRTSGAAATAADHVSVGIYDPEDRKFWPLFELLPGMRVPLLLSRDLGETYIGPGTGTGGQGETAKLMLVAYPAGASQNVNVEGYEF